MRPNDGRVVSNFIVQALTSQSRSLAMESRRARFAISTTLSTAFSVDGGTGRFIGPVNLGNPAEFTIAELAELVVRLTNSRSPLIHKPLPKDDPSRQRRPDTTLAESRLGWRATTPLAEGLGQTIGYFDKLLAELGRDAVARCGLAVRKVERARGGAPSRCRFSTPSCNAVHESRDSSRRRVLSLQEWPRFFKPGVYALVQKPPGEIASRSGGGLSRATNSGEIVVQRCDRFVGRTMNWLSGPLFTLSASLQLTCRLRRTAEPERIPALTAWQADKNALPRGIWRRATGIDVDPFLLRRLRRHAQADPDFTLRLRRSR